MIDKDRLNISGMRHFLQMNETIKAKLSSAIANNKQYAVDFFNHLRSWFVFQADDHDFILHFKPDEIQDVIKEFEKMMDCLSVAESIKDSGEITILTNCIELIIKECQKKLSII